MIGLSIIDSKSVPTPDELCEVAAFIEDASAVACILRSADIKENEVASVMNFFEKALGVASEILTLGLEPNGGTFGSHKRPKATS